MALRFERPKPQNIHSHHRGHTLQKKHSKRKIPIIPSIDTTNDHDDTTPTNNNEYEITYNDTTISLSPYENDKKANPKPKRARAKHKRPRSLVFPSDDDATPAQEATTEDIKSIITFYNKKDDDAKRDPVIQSSDRQPSQLSHALQRAKHRRRRRNNDGHTRARTADIADTLANNDIFGGDEVSAPAEHVANHRRRRRRGRNVEEKQNMDAHFRSQTSVKDIANQLNQIIDEESNKKIEEKKAARARRRPKRTQKRPNSATFADKDSSEKLFFASNTNSEKNTPQKTHHKPPRPKPKVMTKEDIAKTLKQNRKKTKTKRKKIKRPLSATFRKKDKSDKDEPGFFPSNAGDGGEEKKKASKSFFGNRKTKRSKHAKSTPFNIEEEIDSNQKQSNEHDVRSSPGKLSLKRTNSLNLSRIQTSFTSAKKTPSSIGYIESLPTSAEHHGFIYHAGYGMVVFTYDEAMETVRALKRYIYNHNESTVSVPVNTRHLGLPSPVATNPDSEDSKEENDKDESSAADIAQLFVYQPVQFEIKKEEEKNENIGCDVEQDDEKQTAISMEKYHLQNHHKTSSKKKKKRAQIFNDSDKKRTSTGVDHEQQRLDGIRNGYISDRRSRQSQSRTQTQEAVFSLPDNFTTRSRAGNATTMSSSGGLTMPHKKGASGAPKIAQSAPKARGLMGPRIISNAPLQPTSPRLFISESKSTEEENAQLTNHHKPAQKYKRPKGLVLDTADAEDINTESDHVITITKANKKVNRIKGRKEKALSDTLNRARLMALNQQRLKKKRRKKHTKSAANAGSRDDSGLTHSNSLTLTPSVSSLLSQKKRQKIATNVRVKEDVHEDNISLYCFTPKGKHYMKKSCDNNEINSGSPSTPTSPATASPTPNASVKLKIIKSKDRKMRRTKSSRRLKNSFDLRNLVRHNKSDQKVWVKQKQLIQFCPSSSQYYVRDSCLLHWEGKSITDIIPDGAKKMETHKLGLDEKNGTKSKGDLFFSTETDVESIYEELEEKINRLFNNNGGTIYVGVKETEVTDDNNDDAQKKNDSFSLTRKKMMKSNKPKKVNKIPFSIRSRIICGIELNSQMRFELKKAIFNDIIGGFTPQIPHLLNNFFLKFIPVISQNGKIVPSCFVIKVSVFAPILGENGEKVSFRTKDGYCHMIDFDF